MVERKAQTFSKSDYLSPKAAATKYGTDKLTAARIMDKQFKRGTRILTKYGPRPMVTIDTLIHSKTKDGFPAYRLHPLAEEKFKELLAKEK